MNGSVLFCTIKSGYCIISGSSWLPRQPEGALGALGTPY